MKRSVGKWGHGSRCMPAVWKRRLSSNYLHKQICAKELFWKTKCLPQTKQCIHTYIRHDARTTLPVFPERTSLAPIFLCNSEGPIDRFWGCDIAKRSVWLLSCIPQSCTELGRNCCRSRKEIETPRKKYILIVRKWPMAASCIWFVWADWLLSYLRQKQI